MKILVSTYKSWLFGVVILFVLLLVTTINAAAATSHTVQYGDTLASIARQYGATTTSLAQSNNIVNPNLIYIGQVLTIPGAGEAAPAVEAPAAAVQQIHVVQAGESLGRIANRYGTSIWAIQSANNISNANYIYPGQSLVIPAAGSNTPAPPAAASGPKEIIVDISDQRTYVYQGGQLIYNFLSSTGRPGSDTWIGTYNIQNKIPNAYASTWDLQMPYWMGFYYAGHLQNGFHALPILSDGTVLWDGYLGTKVSFGCVILSHADSATLYAWTDVGTQVTVRQ